MSWFWSSSFPMPSASVRASLATSKFGPSYYARIFSTLSEHICCMLASHTQKSIINVLQAYIYFEKFAKSDALAPRPYYHWGRAVTLICIIKSPLLHVSGILISNGSVRLENGLLNSFRVILNVQETFQACPPARPVEWLRRLLQRTLEAHHISNPTFAALPSLNSRAMTFQAYGRR